MKPQIKDDLKLFVLMIIFIALVPTLFYFIF